MWHDNLEAFWDGANHLAVGFGSGSAENDSPAGPSGIGVFVAVDENHPLTLIGVLEATSAPIPWYLIGLPPSHRYVRLRRGDDPEGTNDVELILAQDPMRGGEWRVAIAQTDFRHLFDFASRPAAAAEDDVIRWAASRVKTPMLWGVTQRRLVHRRGPLARIYIAATRLFWPREHRIGIDNNVSRPAEHDARALRPDENAPAIYSRLNVDVPPTIRLRIFLGSAGRTDESFLRRVVLVHMMHQRRHLDIMNRSRLQNSEAVVEPLSIDQVVRYLPENYRDDHAAVDVSGSIAAINLAQALADPELAADRGFELIDVAGTDGCIDVDFYGAVLGDDVGLVSNAAAEGHLQVRNDDPGGFAGARLFRVTELGLQPYAAEESERDIVDLMRSVAVHEDWTGTSGPPPDQESGAWKQFCQRLGLPETGERIEHSLYENIGLLVLAAWANVLTRSSGGQRDGDGEDAIESLKAFRMAPTLISALAPRLALIGTLRVPQPLPAPTAEHTFVRCYAECLGSPNLVAERLDPQADFEAWQVLEKPHLARQYLNAQVCLTGTASEIRSRHELVADQLHDEARVEEFAQSYKERPSAKEQFEDLNAYLEVRRSGDWITLTDAARIAKYCKDIEDEYERISRTVRMPEPASGDLRPRDSRSLQALQAEVDKLAEAGRKLPDVEYEVERIVEELERVRNAATLDRTILRVFEARLAELVGSHLDNQIAEEVIATIQAWAHLPNFLEKMAPRIRKDGGADQRRMRELLRDYVNRVQRSVPKLGVGASVSRFNRLRSDLEVLIKSKLVPNGAEANDAIGAERRRLADDLAGYADILLHHNAYCCILDVINGAERTASPSRVFGEIKLQLRTWPHRATETWERVSEFAEGHYGEGQENPLSRLDLPTV